MAARQPELFRSLAGHEPPLLGLLIADPETKPIHEAVVAGVAPVLELIASGHNEEAACAFVSDVAVGPGAWEMMPEEDRQRTVGNAPTFLDEMRDPDAYNLDLSGLERFDRPTLLSGGDQSPPFFAAILSKLKGTLPAAEFRTLARAGHVPHETNPEEYVSMIREFALPG